MVWIFSVNLGMDTPYSITRVISPLEGVWTCTLALHLSPFNAVPMFPFNLAQLLVPSTRLYKGLSRSSYVEQFGQIPGSWIPHQSHATLQFLHPATHLLRRTFAWVVGQSISPSEAKTWKLLAAASSKNRQMQCRTLVISPHRAIAIHMLGHHQLVAYLFPWLGMPLVNKLSLLPVSANPQ